jgi:hypothetical protein
MISREDTTFKKYIKGNKKMEIALLREMSTASGLT